MIDHIAEALDAIERGAWPNDRRTQHLLDERAIKAERRRYLAEPEPITGFGSLDANEPTTTKGRWT